MTNNGSEDSKKREWTLQMVVDLLNGADGITWHCLQPAAYMLNQLGIPPRHLIAVLRAMKNDDEPCP
jgi:hypothetical protein